MPAVILTGFFMLYLLIAGISDSHPEAKYEPRKIDPMSVPYDTPNAK